MTTEQTAEPEPPTADEQKSLRERIIDIIVREGMVDREKVVGGATLDDLGVQSIDIVIMLNAFEDEFDIYVPIDQTMNDVKNVDDLIAAIEHLIANPPPKPSLQKAARDEGADEPRPSAPEDK